MQDKIIYLDHASTTKLKPQVLEKMTPYLTDLYGNANSTHKMGRLASNGLDNARDLIASIIGAERNEIYFTSGGTEGDNWALRGATYSKNNKNAIVSSSIEHSAVKNTLKQLKERGVNVIEINPSSSGIVNVKDFNLAINEDTFLTCCMWVNNEFGSIQPIKEICEIAHNKNSLFFTDAVQAVGSLKINVKDLGVDMLSSSAHKFGGPKGVGFLYIKNGCNITPTMLGGFQERGKRGGTSNVAGVVGMAEALKLSYENLDNYTKTVTNLRNYFIDRALSEIDGVILNADRKTRVPNNANLTFNGVSGEALLAQLDLNGVCASLGSACYGGAIEPSETLLNLGLSSKSALETLRFTFNIDNTIKEVDYVINVLKTAVKKIRDLT